MFSDIGTSKVTEPPQKVMYSDNNYLKKSCTVTITTSKHPVSELNSCTQKNIIKGSITVS